LGARWGAEAGHGWVFALDGDLGAGKTQLVKGIAQGLGIGARIHSPTFALLNCYEGGRLTLFHLDLYRLESRDQIIAAGLEEFICRPDGVAVIEWAARWFGNPPGFPIRPAIAGARCRQVKMETLDAMTRRICDEDSGA